MIFSATLIYINHVSMAFEIHKNTCVIIEKTAQTVRIINILYSNKDIASYVRERK